MRTLLKIPSVIASFRYHIDFFVQLLPRVRHDDIAFRIKAEPVWVSKTIREDLIEPVNADKWVISRHVVPSRYTHIDAQDTSQQVLCDILSIPTFNMTDVRVVCTTAVAHGNVQVSVRTKSDHTCIVVALLMIHGKQD